MALGFYFYFMICASGLLFRLLPYPEIIDDDDEDEDRVLGARHFLKTDFCRFSQR